MPSPFPGMDPYIEACGLWEDFHPKLISEIERTLSATIPERYFVGLGTRSSDRVAVAESTVGSEARTMQAFVAEPFREIFIEILDRDDERRLVTAIEVLSPSNKRRRSKGRKLYLRKRQALLLGAANLVELDLLRGGQRMPMITPWPNSPYTVLLSRKERAPYCTVWPAYFQRPLPTISIPLAPPDADLHLDLQPLVAAVYARARYVNQLDYSRPLQPAPTEEEAVWLAEQQRNRS